MQDVCVLILSYFNALQLLIKRLRQLSLSYTYIVLGQFISFINVI